MTEKDEAQAPQMDWNNLDKPSRQRRKDRQAEKTGLRAVGPDERDPTPEWLRDSGGSYDPAKFYVRSSDSRGHQHHVKAINVPQSWAQPMAMLREYFPEYRTNADIIRDAIVHLMMVRLKQIEAGEITEMMAVELNAGKMDYNILVMSMRTAEVESTREALETASNNKDWARLDIILDTLEEQLADEAERHGDSSPYYQAKLKLFKERSGEMKRVRERGEWKDRE